MIELSRCMALAKAGALKLIRGNPIVDWPFFLRRNCTSISRELSSGLRLDDDENGSRSRQHQCPPHPIPNRPLRGDRPSSNPQPQFQTSDRAQERPAQPSSPRLSDSEFLNSLRIGVDKKPSQEDPLPNCDSMAGTADESESQKVRIPPDADAIFKKMKESGLIPNAVAMLDGLCKDGLVQEAMKLFGLMREKGTIPEVVIYTAVVEGFCKAHKPEDAKRIFMKMLKNGITPNAFTYGVLIRGLYNCNMMDDAIDFSVEMLKAGHSPNVATFVGLVDGLCREKGVEETRIVLKTLRNKGFFLPDKPIREFLDKNGPSSSLVWEAIFDKKPLHNLFGDEL